MVSYDSPNFTTDSSVTQSGNDYGFKLTVDDSFFLRSITVNSINSATKAYLFDSSEVLQQTVDVNSKVAVFNKTMKKGETWTIVFGADGASYTFDYKSVVTTNEVGTGDLVHFTAARLQRPSNWIYSAAASVYYKIDGYPITSYEDLFEDCVLYLDMNGDAKDVTNNNNDGTVTGATLTTDHLGNANRAYLSDGDTSNNYITLDSSITHTGEFTISFWINLTAYNSSYGIVGSNTATSYWGVRQNGGNDFVLVAPGGSEKNFATSGLVGNWNHIIITRDSSDAIRVYINGVESSTGAISSGTTFVTAQLLRLFSNASYDLDGKLGTVGIWSRHYSSDEAKQFYDLTKTKYIYEFPQEVSE